MLSVLVALIVVGALLYLVNLIPLDATIKKIIQFVVILFVCLWLLKVLFGVNVPDIKL